MFDHRRVPNLTALAYHYSENID